MKYKSNELFKVVPKLYKVFVGIFVGTRKRSMNDRKMRVIRSILY